MPNVLTPLTPRVLLMIHNPIIEAEGSRRLNQVLGWNDPDRLCAEYIRDVEECSYGGVRYQIVERVELDEYPAKQDGFRYDDVSFLRAWRTRTGFHHPDTADYPALIRQVDLPHKVQAGEVDELWMFGFPYAGFYESCMGGRGAIWCNGPVIPGTTHVSRPFVVMGFNYERGVGEMLENLGHRAENIMEHVFRDVPDESVSSDRVSSVKPPWLDKLLGAIGLGQASTENPNSEVVNLSGNLWRQFIRYDQTHPNLSGCGNVHFAPSSMSDYDWGNRRMVLSNADDWLNYPNFTGESREMNAADWGNGDIREHHKWWFKRFPHVEGTTPTGKLNNWWRYVVGLHY
jgi:hypothetical protein